MDLLGVIIEKKALGAKIIFKIFLPENEIPSKQDLSFSLIYWLKENSLICLSPSKNKIKPKIIFFTGFFSLAVFIIASVSAINLSWNCHVYATY